MTDRPSRPAAPDRIPPWRRFAALGDSVTEGLADALPNGALRGWADLLAARLADRAGHAIEYANLAVRGRLLAAIVTDQVEAALALEPDLVSLWGGGNDMLRPASDPDALAAALEAAVVRLRARGADVLLGTGIDCKGTPLLRATRARTAAYNANIWSLARRHGARVMDAWGMRCLRDPRMWHADRIHLSEAGHERVCQAALVGLGLAPDRPAWDEPLAPLPPAPRIERLGRDLAWVRDHLAPWVSRRLRGVSSGDGVRCKHPAWVTVAPSPDEGEDDRPAASVDRAR